MAKILERLDNGLNIRYLKKPKKYFLFNGNTQTTFNYDNGRNGFNTIDEARKYGQKVYK